MEPLLAVFAVWGCGGLVWWYFSLLAVTDLGGGRWQRLPLVLLPPLCALIIYFALRGGAAREVQTSPGYMLLLLGSGIAWVIVCAHLFALLGLSIRDDAVERNNTAALIAAGGGMLGVTLAYAGGNIGEGTELWQNIFCAGLATAGLFALWMLLELMSKISIAITVERNVAAGVRLAAWLLAVGLILGRAVAGDWHSAAETWHDFLRDGSGALVLLVAAPLEYGLQPTHRWPFPSWKTVGIIPGVLYLAWAAMWLRHVGHW